MLKRCLLILVVLATIFSLYIVTSAQAENNSINTSNYCIESFSRSYAWNDRYLFMAYPYSKPYEGWDYYHVALIRIDRQTKEIDILEADYPYGEAFLFLEDDNLYILLPPSFEMDDSVLKRWRGNPFQLALPDLSPERQNYYQLISMDFDGNIQDSMWINSEDGIGSIFYEGCLYVIGDDRVVCYDTEQKTREIIYYASNYLQNSPRWNPPIIENGLFYLYDGMQIISIDLQNQNTQVEYSGLDSQVFIHADRINLADNYRYLILDRQLYFWDDHTFETVAINLDDGNRRMISRDCFIFMGTSEDGIAAYRISQEEVKAAYTSEEDGEKKFIDSAGNVSLSIPDEKIEPVFYSFPDPESPFFDPEGMQATHIDDYQFILINNGEFILNGDPLHVFKMDDF